jgi:hypothetical protein
MFARRREQVIGRLRPGILIKNLMIIVFFTVRHLIVLDVFPKGQKSNQEYFVQSIFPSLLNEKKRF